MFKLYIMKNTFLVILLIVAAYGNDENDDPAQLEDEKDSSFEDIELPYNNTSKADASEVVLIERTAEKVKADSILSGMETLKESPLVSSTDFRVPEVTEDELLEREEEREDSERTVETEDDTDEVGVIERQGTMDSDYVDDSYRDEEISSRLDFDPFDDLPLSRRMMKQNIPIQFPSPRDKTPRILSDKVLEVTNTKPNLAPKPFIPKLVPCCGNMRFSQVIPKDPVIPNPMAYPYNPYPVHPYSQYSPLPLKPYNTVDRPAMQTWLNNKYPFSTTTITSVMPNMDPIGQRNENLLKLPLPYKPNPFYYIPRF